MSTYPNVREQNLITLPKLPEQLKNQRAIKIKYKISKHTHDKKLAESFEPISKKLTEVNQSTQ